MSCLVSLTLQSSGNANSHSYRGSQFPEAKIKATTDKTALKALPAPEDVAEQIKALVLSKSITGQNIVIDGGIAI